MATKAQLADADVLDQITVEPQLGVTIEPNGLPPSSPADDLGIEAASLSREMMLRAELFKQNYTDEVEMAASDGTIRSGGEIHGSPDLQFKAITHHRARTIWLYKPTGEYTPVPADNLDQCIEDGWTVVCPDCHTNCHRALWGCARLPEPRYRPCIVCGMKFHELKSFSYDAEAENDPLRIVDEEDKNMTEMDSRSRRAEHMRYCHPASYAAFYAAPTH